MSNVIIDDANLSNIANAIREKNGSTDTYKPADMPQAILDISSGGGTPKPEQVKFVDITENGTTEVVPDDGKVLSKVTVNVDVPTSDTEDLLQYVYVGNSLFKEAKSFPSKAVVNLPNAQNLYQAFSYWSVEPIPIVEELIVNAPSLTELSTPNGCIAQMFAFNYGVKKVVLNFPNGLQKMNNLFATTKNLEEVTLNFSTKNVTHFNVAFQASTARKIIGILDFSSATNVMSMFNGSSNLEEVTFAQNTLSVSMSLAQSSKLTADSVQSIIDGLATVETAQTLTLSANAKILQSQVDSANAKGWTIAGGTVVSEEEYYG